MEITTYGTYSYEVIGLNGSSIEHHDDNKGRADNQYSDPEALVATFPGNILVVDDGHRIRFTNRSHEGHSRGEIIGESIYSFFEPSFCVALKDLISNSFEVGEGTTVDGVTTGLPGIDNWCQIRLEPISRGDQVVAVALYLVDIAERKTLEMGLEHALGVTKSILDRINIGIVTIMPDKTIRRVNNAALKMLGNGSEKELVGKNCYDHFCQSGKDECPVLDLELPVINQESWIMGKEGQKCQILKTTLLTTVDGEEVILDILVDISDLEKAKKALVRKSEELKRSNAELQQFAYVASHDLQEPLRMVTSYIQLLLKRCGDKFDENAERYMSYAVDGANRMRDLINDLLEYSRVETQGKTFEKYEVEDIITKVLNILKMKIQEANAVVTHDPLPPLICDALQLSQVFQNLIANALKFHKKENPKIHVAAKEDEEYWTFSVKDDGIGIDLKYSDRIFAIFQRLHTRKEYEGTGIGLAICKRIIERHGGRIWFESEVGKGTIFYFTILKSELGSNE